MKWLIIVSSLCYASSAACPATCTANSECPMVNNATMCCVKGICQPAVLLPAGRACSLGRTQDQVCAWPSAGSGSCGAASAFLGLSNQGGSPDYRYYTSDELCVNGKCQWAQPKPTAGQGCACTNDTECGDTSVCDGTCLAGERDPGENCTSPRQCKNGQGCTGGKCQPVPLGGNCTYENCIGDPCTDGCSPNRCSPAGICYAPPDRGQACNTTVKCKPGLFCNVGTGTCGDTTAKLGQNCTNTLGSTTYPSCELNLFCDLQATPRVCKTLYSRPDNETCDSHGECMSHSCLNNNGTRRCFAGPVLDLACNSTGSDECSANHTCNCATKKCMPINTSVPCYQQLTDFTNIIASAFRGIAPDNATLARVQIDLPCCLECSPEPPNLFLALDAKLDCTARTISPPPDACLPTTHGEITGCAGWLGQQSPTVSPGASTIPQFVAVLIGIAVFCKL